MWAIQQMAEFKREQDAAQCHEAAKEQEGYLGGRLLPPTLGRGWRVQVFMEAGDIKFGDWLPDGCRLVLVPESQMRALGIVGKEEGR